MTQHAQMIDQIKALSASVEPVSHAACGFHLDVRLPGESIREVASLLYDNAFYLVFVTGVHHSTAVEVIYMFGHFDEQYRIQIRSDADTSGHIPTISDIFQGADWHEREVKDFFGVIFDGHPNLIPLLLDPSDEDLKPLLKTDETVKPATALQWQSPDTDKAGKQPASAKKVSKKDEN